MHEISETLSKTKSLKVAFVERLKAKMRHNAGTE